jgi:hypothetical protein
MKNNQKPTFGEDNLNNRVLQTYNTGFIEKEKLMNDRINMYGRGGEVETNVQHKKGGMVTSKKK